MKGTLNPLVDQPAIYFDNNPDFADFYRTRMAEMRHFAALIAVSEATRQEALTLLDYPQAHLHLVTEDAGPQFTPPGAMSLTDMTDLRRRHGLMRPYILYVGGGEPRKPRKNPMVQIFWRLWPFGQTAAQLAQDPDAGVGQRELLAILLVSVLRTWSMVFDLRAKMEKKCWFMKYFSIYLK